MKKTVLLILTVAAFCRAEIIVPPGAVMETTVKAVVPVESVRVTKLICDLSSNAAPFYVVSLELTDANGRKVPKTVRVTQDQASAMMSAAGYSLTNIVGSALGAIQVMINQQFSQ